MKSVKNKDIEIIVETKDGSVVRMNRGQTYIDYEGRDITYEQMLKWILDGSLRQHGFYPYKGHTSKSISDNNYAARNAIRTALLAATL